MATGTVHVWSAGRGSGWIKSDGGGDRVYVHKSGIEASQPGVAPRLEPGQRVEFQIGQRPKGSAAINVRPAAEIATDVPAQAPPVAKGKAVPEPVADTADNEA